MVNYCVVTNCNSRGGFKFPVKPGIRQQWVRFVRMHRLKWSGPSKHSVICSRHFKPEEFEENPVMESLGFKSRLVHFLTMFLLQRGRCVQVPVCINIFSRQILKPNAVPTLFFKKDGQDEVRKETTKRTAFEKREHLRVSMITADDRCLLIYEM